MAARARAAGREPWLETGVSHALVSAILFGIAGDVLGPFARVWFALAISALLLVGPLLGGLGVGLFGETGEDWLRCQPVREGELRLARLLATAKAVIRLALFSLIPSALLGAGFGALLLGLAQALTLAALLGALQGVARGRMDRLLIGLQAGLLLGVFASFLVLPDLIAWLRPMADSSDLPTWARWLPPSLFARLGALGGFPAPSALGTALALGVGVLTTGLAALLPVRRTLATHAVRGPLEWLVQPLGSLLRRIWVRPEEAPAYDLVRWALPREREVSLRALPLLALPLGFAWVAMTRPPGPERAGLLALLLFAPGFYLPILQLHVAASASASARHLLDLSPRTRAALGRGAAKALVATYLCPTMLALFLLAGFLGGWRDAARVAPLALVCAVLCLRLLYPRTVVDLPLSLPLERIGGTESLAGPLISAGVALALLALLAQFALVGWPASMAALGLLLLLERLTDRQPVPER